MPVKRAREERHVSVPERYFLSRPMIVHVAIWIRASTEAAAEGSLANELRLWEIREGHFRTTV